MGLHQNADITKDINESVTLLESLQLCGLEQNSGSIQGKSHDEGVTQIVQSIIN